jgi:hypothetical protein
MLLMHEQQLAPRPRTDESQGCQRAEAPAAIETEA